MTIKALKRERRELLFTVEAAEALFGSRPWEAHEWTETRVMYEERVREIEAELERRRGARADRAAVEELLRSL